MSGLEFKSGWIHPLDRFPQPKTLRDVIEKSDREQWRKQLGQSYRAPRTEAVVQLEARRYPEQRLLPLPEVPVSVDETGQLGWMLEEGWLKEQK